MSVEKKPLPVCTPEEVGIPSEALLRYIDALEEKNMHMHSVMVVRNGKNVCEGYWKPMQPDFMHRLYSCSKSFLSVAVGLLIEQGLLSLDDKAIKFFPDKAPENPHPHLEEMTIRDLLCMATCFSVSGSYYPALADWADSFFAGKVTQRPGHTFTYQTVATTELCNIVKRVSGKQFMEVLRPVFDEIGVSDDAFCAQSPCGYEWGGSAVYMTTRDFAKFGQLCMRYGLHEGKQILPRDYMQEATSAQIPNWLYGTTPDNSVGYGYQFWPTRFGGFAMRGMGGQFMLALPDKDFVLVTTAYDELNASGKMEIINAAFRLIYPEMSDQPLPANPEAAKKLKERTDNLAYPVVQGEYTSPMAEKINGKKYVITGSNQLDVKSLSFTFEGDEGTMTWENATGEHSLRFGLGHLAQQEFPEPGYAGRHIGTPLDRGYDCLADAAWLMPNALALEIQIIDLAMANIRWMITFEDDTVTVQGRKHAEWFMDGYDGYAAGVAK